MKIKKSTRISAVFLSILMLFSMFSTTMVYAANDTEATTSIESVTEDTAETQEKEIDKTFDVDIPPNESTEPTEQEEPAETVDSEIEQTKPTEAVNEPEQTPKETEPSVEPTNQSESKEPEVKQEPYDMEYVELPKDSKVTIEIIQDATENRMSFLRSANVLMDRQANQVGDVAVKSIVNNTYSDFRWTSITNGHNVVNARTYGLTDANGVKHTAYCIDADLKAGVGHTATYTGQKFTGIGAGALYAIYSNNVSGHTIRGHISIPPTPVGNTTLPGVEEDFKGTVSPNNMTMAMRFLAWTNNGRGNIVTPYNNTYCWNDFLNFAAYSGAIPKFYLNKSSISFEHGDGTPIIGAGYRPKTSYVISPKCQTFGQQKQSDGNEDPTEEIVWIKTFYEGSEITLDNYNTLLNGDLKAFYINNILDKIVKSSYDAAKSTALAYSNHVGYIWSSGSNEQRFVTFEYVPQELKLQLKKVSTRPDITNGNKMYSLKGISYDVFVDGKKITTLKLDENGNSNVYKFEPPASYRGKTAILREVDDNVRRTSGYRLNTNDVTIVLKNGKNIAEASDPPILDPTYLILNKVDAETGESYDKLGL